MTFKKLKIKLWLQENKKILWLLELIFTIILVFLFGNKIKIPKIKFSSEAIGVTGTLLGAFIGGFFSFRWQGQCGLQKCKTRLSVKC